jgi:hypothetical protein
MFFASGLSFSTFLAIEDGKYSDSSLECDIHDIITPLKNVYKRLHV